MATPMAKSQCFTCEKETRTYNCAGCGEDFCLNCLTKHIQTLGLELDQIENDHDQFRERLNEQKDDPTKNLLIQKINQWEQDSIEKIKQTATECRETLIHHSNKFVVNIEKELNNIARELKRIREENQFNEIDVKHFKEKLNQLKQELAQPTNILLKRHSTPFIDRMSVSILLLHTNTEWKQNGMTVVGRKNEGCQSDQLDGPRGICIDDDQNIYIADRGNHRIVEWKLNGTQSRIVAGGNGRGRQTDRLHNPKDVVFDQERNSLIIGDQGNRRVMRWSRENNDDGEVIISDIDCSRLTMDRDGSLYVSDYVNHEVRRWKRGEKGKGKIVAGGNGQGDRLDQLDHPTGIFVDDNYSLYVADGDNHRVMKWIYDSKEGLIVAGGNGQGNSLSQFSNPAGVIVGQLGQIYVADFDNNRVMCWCQGVEVGKVVVGGNGYGRQSNQFRSPLDLSFDGEGNLYVADCANHRIQKFEIQSNEMNSLN